MLKGWNKHKAPFFKLGERAFLVTILDPTTPTVSLKGSSINILKELCPLKDFTLEKAKEVFTCKFPIETCYENFKEQIKQDGVEENATLYYYTLRGI